jgi:hypothetical protein
MANLGGWEIKVAVGKLPEKVATAFGNLNLMGAEYTPIAYLGSQVVNGINHAVLAEQLLITGRDQKNIVLMIFNEKGEEVTLVNIERIIEEGAPMGGIHIDVQTEVPEDVKAVFHKVFEGYVGANLEPVVYLGSQVTKGTNYILLTVISGIRPCEETTVALTIVNAVTDERSFVDILSGASDVASLGYAFTWLKGNVSLGKPLGDWP